MSTNEIAAPRRRPVKGGYARGEETRARIITAAVQVFGSEGYERASTRQISDAAGVNPPALQYYFDSKDGLHRACAQFIIDEVNVLISPSLRSAEIALASRQPDRALDALCDLIDVLVGFSVTHIHAADWKPFMARAQADGAGPAATLIRDGIVFPLHDSAARLVGAVIGRSAQDIQTRLRASAVLSQMSAFHLNRESTLACLGWSDLGDGRLTKVRAVLRAHTRAALMVEI